MLENNYFARLKTLFFERGISHRQSERLIEELQDHLMLKIAELKVEGTQTAEAERLALQFVGTPDDIAEKASADLQGGWLMRYAWLPCGGGFFLGGLSAMFALMLLGYYFSGMSAYYHSDGEVSWPLVRVEVLLLNWLPLLLGMTALTLLIRFSSIGWKSIFFAALALGIAVGSDTRIDLAPIAESTKFGFLAIDYNFIMRWLFRPLASISPPSASPILIIKLLAPLAMCLFARYVQPLLGPACHFGQVRE